MDRMSEEESAKVGELRTALGSLSGRAQLYCSDACLKQYLRARRGNIKKAKTMLKDTLEWRASFKPEDIKWEDVSVLAETGKMYIASFVDKHSRPVIRMTPAKENTDIFIRHVQYMVYTMESAALHLPPDQQQLVVIVDFKGWSIFKVTPISIVREIAHVLQNHYPERQALGIMLNPPKVFEYFWKLWKPLIDPATYQKARFVYTNDMNSLKVMEDIFDKQILASIFESQYNHLEYSKKMQEDDAHKASYWKSADTDFEPVNGAGASFLG